MSKSGKKKENEVISIVEKYMLSQNRPYNAKMVIENLAGIHGKDALGKKPVETALETLTEKGVLQSKVHKKAKLYWPTQKDENIPSPEELSQLDEQIQSLREESNETSAQVKALALQTSQLSTELTDDQIEEEIKRLQAEMQKLQARVALLKDTSRPIITAEEKSALEKKRKFNREEWRKRKRKFGEITSSIEEGMDPAEFKKMKTDMGIETDSEIGCHFDQDHYSRFLKKQEQ